MNTIKPKATTKKQQQKVWLIVNKKKIKNNKKIRKGEKRTENTGGKKINGKMVDLNLTISIITLNGYDKKHFPLKGRNYWIFFKAKQLPATHMKPTLSIKTQIG